MKRLVLILILTFSFQLWTMADDIRDYEIEGISVGDSLLDYFSKDEILREIKDNKYMYNYLTNEFGEVYKRDGLSKYFMISFYVKPKDEKFIIHGLTGTMPHVEDITECHKQLNVIANEFSTIFKDSKKIEENYNHGVDKSGKSKVKEIYFLTKSEDEARIICMDFEESLRIKNNWIDGLDISLSTKELNNWLSNYIN
jgi:hypothetical protein